MYTSHVKDISVGVDQFQMVKHHLGIMKEGGSHLSTPAWTSAEASPPPGVGELGLGLESESWVSAGSRKGHQEPPPAAPRGRFLPRSASTPSLSVKSSLLKLIKLCNCEIVSN